MNNDYALYNLKEAQEQLAEIINEIENGEALNSGSYYVEMQHLYHHLNTAWNARYASENETEECSDCIFKYHQSINQSDK